MKRLIFGSIVVVTSALAVGLGCNAILGNEPGLLPAGAIAEAGIAEAGGCAAGTKSCEGVCVSVQDPSAGCGGACSACATPPNAAAACQLNAGSFACALGACQNKFADCDDDPKNGCEAHLTTKATCGDCSNDCTTAGLPFCEPSSDGGAAFCSATCDSPFTDCCATGPCASSSDPTGDCVDLSSDPKNCGSCHQDCAAVFPNAQVSCNGGTCAIDSCNPGFARCASGCVAQSDTQCGTTCVNCTQTPQPVCSGGVCVACPSSQVYCAATGCHVEDNSHCGAACADCGSGTCDPGTHQCVGGTSCNAPTIACTAPCCSTQCIDPTSVNSCGADGTSSCGSACDPADAGIRCCASGVVGDPIVPRPPSGGPAGGYHCGSQPLICP